MSKECNDTNIPKVDDTQLECCDIVSTKCVSLEKKVNILGLPIGATLTDFITKIVNFVSSNPFEGFTYQIGEYVEEEGGVVFHRFIDGGNESYLIVSIEDETFATPWSNITNTQIGSSAQSSWNGNSNSDAIISQSGHTNSAAQETSDSLSGGKNDWYLPSVDEAALLWNNRYNVNRTLSGQSSVGSITGAQEIALLPYWTSTERDAGSAWTFSFIIGNLTSTDKTNSAPARGIRKITI